MPRVTFTPDLRNSAHRPSAVFIEGSKGWAWGVTIQYGLIARKPAGFVFGSRDTAKSKAAKKLARLQKRWDDYEQITVVGDADLATPLRPPLPPRGPGAGSRPSPPPPRPNRDLT